MYYSNYYLHATKISNNVGRISNKILDNSETIEATPRSSVNNPLRCYLEHVKFHLFSGVNDNARTIRLPVNVVQDLHKAKKAIESNGGKLDDKFQNLPSMVDLDMKINEDGDTLVDVIKNDQAEMPDDIFNTKDELKSKLLSLLDVLDERERVIIGDYYGLTGTQRTLEDIGTDFSLTKERVRQIKEKALRKLRNDSSSLFEYI